MPVQPAALTAFTYGFAALLGADRDHDDPVALGHTALPGRRDRVGHPGGRHVAAAEHQRALVGVGGRVHGVSIGFGSAVPPRL